MISFGIEAAGPILKLLRERSVWAPQYLSAGTCTSPIVSCSILYDMVLENFCCTKLTKLTYSLYVKKNNDVAVDERWRISRFIVMLFIQTREKSKSTREER